MPRSVTESFVDALARIAQEIARAELAPDADLEFLAEMRGMIIERFQNPNLGPVGVSVAGTQPNYSAQQLGGQPASMGMGQGMGGQQMQMAPGRLPPGGTGGGGEVEELSRILAGS